MRWQLFNFTFMKFYRIVFFLIFISVHSSMMGHVNNIDIKETTPTFQEITIYFSDTIPGDSLPLTITLKKKGEAIIFWVLGGIVGLHRIYLGTSPVIPVFYALTIGGGGIIFISDLIALIVVKDINQFANKDQIIMWINEKSKTQP
ncbi:MAG: hypothetical protein CVU05_09215 [Bacteroidetes bacterium HGW-Bacteroidetes-21]|nr:MAG: hypothetical protein CVU05_09215 [Bacteroidetes bacterium HGW-Bacteroidetes-21]